MECHVVRIRHNVGSYWLMCKFSKYGGGAAGNPREGLVGGKDDREG